jgi:hypothetical protein
MFRVKNAELVNKSLSETLAALAARLTEREISLSGGVGPERAEFAL